jgi:CHAT domain-containing protein/tetratricopeptide (TPR) repeat protein
MGRTFVRIVRAMVLASVAIVAAQDVWPPDLASATRRGPARDDRPISRLQPGVRTQGDLAADGDRTYCVSLAADQYIELRVEQQGIELSIRVSSPDGSELLATSNPTGSRESRTLAFITTATGDYNVRLAPAARRAAPGQYVVTLATPRAPSSAERQLEDARLQLARAATLIRQGKYDDALTPAKRSLEVRESVLGPEQPQVADALHVLAEIYDNKGNYKEAEPINLRALEIREKALGADHQDVARSLFNLGWIYLERQDYAKAEATYQRALTIQERVFGESHREVATTLNDFAILYERKGEYEKAIELDRRVLAVRERIFGSSDVGVALSLNNLGLNYVRVGDDAQAERCLQRSLQIFEEKSGPNHPDVATAANNLAMVYEDKGDYPAGERLVLRALAINEAARGPNHPSVGANLTSLGWLYEHEKDYAKATTFYRRALAVREAAFGPTHSEVGEALNNLANVYIVSRTGNDDEIVSLLDRSRTILERALGPDNVKVAAPIATLAKFYEDHGQPDLAEPLYQRSLTIEEQTLGPEHPKVASLVGRLAAVYETQGDTARALERWTRYGDVRERNLEHNVPLGSDRQKLTYLSLFAGDLDRLLSFHAQTAPNNAAALRLAVTTVLRLKGRGLDAIADTVGVLRAHANADDGALFTSLAESRARLASLTLRGPEHDDATTYRTHLEQISTMVEHIEGDISRRSAEFRSESRPITIDAVQAAVPADAALIEFALYHPQGAVSQPAAPKYSAYLVFPSGRIEWVDLGDAPSLNRLMDEWRRALRDPRRDDVRALGRAVDERLMRPVRMRLGATRQLLVSPDGPLHLIPFAALVDEEQRYLVDRYAITYLTSGRDLLRLQVPRESRGAPVVIADPTFGSPALVASSKGSASSSNARVDYSQMFFGPLPGVSGEVEALRTLLPQATFLTKEHATKAALAQVAGPRILHIATHGFFLQDASSVSDVRDTAIGRDHTLAATVVAERVENPLLRSGLALAGANAGGGSSNGVLTALEAADLNLWGTQLVVLSACDTGVGEVKNGDGVYGLRRALVLAGSESQVISLWPVSDTGTRDLVIGFYTDLLRGSGRGEALRRVQQEMLHSSARAHPYFWASFILSGQWTTLDLHQ